MKWSEYQQAIFDAVAHTKDSLIIEAVAGSGKTTTIVEAINHVPRHQSVAFMAFNKSIADELKRRITASNARCMTLHSAGFGAWRRYLGDDGFTVQVNARKISDILNDEEVVSKEERRMFSGGLSKLIGIAKGSGIVPYPTTDEMKGFLALEGDKDEDWVELIDFYNVDFEISDVSLELARRILAHSIKTSQQEIDFDDMLFMPVITKASFEKYDVIFLDEAQDVNAIQVEIVDRMRKPTSRVIAVGDPNQAIYGFRGALSESMAHIQQRFGCKSLPLSVSYRCPKEVVTKARNWVSHIESHESAPPGEVIDPLTFWPLTDFLPTDAILCRINRPLIETAFLLIRNKVPCKVLGRDIGQGLIALIKKMKALTIPQLEEKMELHREREARKPRNDESKMAALDDKMDTIRVFIDELGPDDGIDTLKFNIEALFADAGAIHGMVTLSTVHKAKGLEWPRVFVLDAHIYMPMRYAVRPWQRQQEWNLMYVAATRAKESLYYVSSGTLRGEKLCPPIGHSPSALLEESVPEQSTGTEDSEETIGDGENMSDALMSHIARMDKEPQ